jgi:hypothetical protein
LGRRLGESTIQGKMNKLIAFVIFHLSFVILCASTNAQWGGAEAQRLTYNHSRNYGTQLYIDESNKLFLFHHQYRCDPEVQPCRDTMLLITKEEGEEWSQPEKVGNLDFEVVGYSRYLSYDPNKGVTHILYSTYPGNSVDDTLYYTNSNTPDWEVSKVDSLPGAGPSARYEWVCMDFDTSGNVHLVWNLRFDSLSANWYRVMYANNSTGQWTKQQVSEPMWLGGMKTATAHLAVQENGAAHIAYHDAAYCDLECVAFYATNDTLNGDTWTIDTLPKPSRPLWSYSPRAMDVDVNDRVHLITGGCTEEYCIEEGRYRRFYYYKDPGESIWHGPEQIPDTAFGFTLSITQLRVDEYGLPYASYLTFSNEVYFTERKQGSWQVPYELVGWHEGPDSLGVDDFSFVLDSEGHGHGAFDGLDVRHAFDNDSMEVYFLSCSNSAVDTWPEASPSHFRLSQNYPNPFNSFTSIQYTASSRQNHPVHTTLKIYNILGKEVRELVNTNQSTGSYSISWDGKDNLAKEVASGLYFYQLTVREAHPPEQSRGKAGDYRETKKLVLIK